MITSLGLAQPQTPNVNSQQRAINTRTFQVMTSLPAVLGTCSGFVYGVYKNAISDAYDKSSMKFSDEALNVFLTTLIGNIVGSLTDIALDTVNSPSS